MQVPSGLLFVRRHQDGLRGERARQGVRGDVPLDSARLRRAHRATLAAGMNHDHQFSPTKVELTFPISSFDQLYLRVKLLY